MYIFKKNKNKYSSFFVRVLKILNKNDEIEKIIIKYSDEIIEANKWKITKNIPKINEKTGVYSETTLILELEEKYFKLENYSKYYEEKEQQNALIIMTESGAKGDPINIAQITSLLGQQFVSQQRMKISKSGRTIPYFPPNSLDPEARGFCTKSYIEGLDPASFFFHAVSGREGLVDTNIGTQDTGSLQRNLVKAMEDLKIYNDGTVRKSNGSIVQLAYGLDGLSIKSTKRVKVKGKDRYSFINIKNIAESINYKYSVLKSKKTKK